MIEVDGSFGEGGGQILRTAVALSALTGTPVRVYNIRAGRHNPGLKAQHVTGIDAVARVCDARVEGGTVGSGEVSFHPGGIKSGDFTFDVGTAGSVTLVIQSLLPAVVFNEGRFSFKISGGTDVSWSPQADYLRHVTIPVLEKFGCKIGFEVVKRGYYPNGGGLVELKVEGGGLGSVELLSRGKVDSIHGVSHASSSLKERSVCERQASGAKKSLVDYGSVDVSCEYSNAYSIGSGITLWAECENAVLGAGFLGAKDLKVEDVGRKAALGLLNEIKSGACLDRHMADQIVPYLAIAGGKATVSEVTEHCKTNIWVAGKFGYDVTLEGRTILSTK